MSEFRFATVTSTSPLLVRFATDETDTPVAWSGVATSVVVIGDKALCSWVGTALILIAIRKGP